MQDIKDTVLLHFKTFCNIVANVVSIWFYTSDTKTSHNGQEILRYWQSEEMPYVGGGHQYNQHNIFEDYFWLGMCENSGMLRSTKRAELGRMSTRMQQGKEKSKQWFP